MELKELYALMERFEKSGLSELLFKKNGEEVCLKKNLPLPAAPLFMPAPHAAPEPRGAPRPTYFLSISFRWVSHRR